MKIAVLSDVHLEAKPYNLEQKQLDIYDSFIFALQIIESEDVDYIIISGDLFDKPKVSYTTVKYASLLQKFKDKIFFIEGNHDIGVSEFFEAIGVKKKEIIALKEDLFLAGLDWINDHNVLKEKIRILKENIYTEKTILVLHANLKEAMPFLKESYTYITYNDIKDFKFCVVSHIHNTALIENKVLIPGSLERLDITNLEERRLYILNINENNDIEINFYNIPTRLILESDNISLIEKVVNRERLKPIIFYTGKPEDISPAQFLLFESKCLLFRIRTKASKVFDEILNIDIQLTEDSIKDFIIEFFKQFNNLNKELIDCFITNFGNKEKIDVVLDEFINKKLNKEDENVSSINS